MIKKSRSQWRKDRLFIISLWENWNVSPKQQNQRAREISHLSEMVEPGLIFRSCILSPSNASNDSRTQSQEWVLSIAGGGPNKPKNKTMPLFNITCKNYPKKKWKNWLRNSCTTTSEMYLEFQLNGKQKEETQKEMRF